MSVVVELEEHPAAAVVRVGGRIDTARLRAVLVYAVERHPCVVVDLAALNTLDDTSLGLLVRAHRSARRQGGVVCLAGVSRVALTVLHTMRVDGLFPLFDDTAAALEHLGGGSSGDRRLQMLGRQG